MFGGIVITIVIALLVAGDGYLLFTNYKSNLAYNEAIRSNVCTTSDIVYDQTRHVCGSNYCYSVSYNITTRGKTTHVDDLLSYNESIPSKVDCWTNLVSNEMSIRPFRERKISDNLAIVSVVIMTIATFGIIAFLVEIPKKFHRSQPDKGYELTKI